MEFIFSTGSLYNYSIDRCFEIAVRAGFDGVELLVALRLDRLLGRMAGMGYNHAVSLELHPDALDAGQDDEHVVALLANSLAHCRRWAELEETVAVG